MFIGLDPYPNQGSKIWVPALFTLLKVMTVLLGPTVKCMPSAKRETSPSPAI